MASTKSAVETHSKREQNADKLRKNASFHDAKATSNSCSHVKGSSHDKACQEEPRKKPASLSQNSSRFSLLKIGRSSTFTFRKKAKEKESEPLVTEKKKETTKEHKSKSREVAKQTETSSKHVERPCSLASSSKSKESSVRVKCKGAEEKVSRRNKDTKRKNTACDYEHFPSWLQNPPKILIQDFSSDYVDETGFYDEYFELVEWAFQVLRRQCCSSIEQNFRESDTEQDVDVAGEQTLTVITNETARVGNALDYILHPISTGAANVMQTGAKFADFTTRVWRGIHFDALVHGRSKSSPDK